MPPATRVPPLYFGAALDAAAHASFVLQSVAAEQSTDLDPSRFAFVVLSDSLALPSIFEHALAAYVAKGGSVLIALGTSAAHHRTHSAMGRRMPAIRTTMPAQVRCVRSARSTSAIPPLAQAQPGRDNGGWAEVKVLYAVPVDPAQARVAARLTDGTPLLLEKQIGEGCAFCCSLRASTT